MCTSLLCFCLGWMYMASVRDWSMCHARCHMIVFLVLKKWGTYGGGSRSGRYLCLCPNSRSSSGVFLSFSFVPVYCVTAGRVVDWARAPASNSTWNRSILDTRLLRVSLPKQFISPVLHLIFPISLRFFITRLSLLIWSSPLWWFCVHNSFFPSSHLLLSNIQHELRFRVVDCLDCIWLVPPLPDDEILSCDQPMGS